MVEFARKTPYSPTAEVGVDTPEVTLEVAGPDAVASPSPARSLQTNLEQEISRSTVELSMREVIATLVVFCFAVWWALYMLVSNLI